MTKFTFPTLRPPRILADIKLNFYRVHLVYFIVIILLSSVIVYGSTANGNSGDAESHFHLRYIDALYLCASAMTSTGLNTVNLSSITGFQQAVLFTLIPLGNVMVVSTSVVYVRRYWFRKKMAHFLEHTKAGRALCEDLERQKAHPVNHRGPNYRAESSAIDSTSQSDSASENTQGTDGFSRRTRRSESHLTEHGGFPLPWQTQQFQNVIHHPFKILRERSKEENHDYLSFQPSLDHKGRIHSLDERQRIELGGVEYRALRLLSWLLPTYILFWFLLGLVILVPYSMTERNIASIVRTSQPGNLDPGWWATFTIVSALGNCGISPLDSNMVPFQGYYLVLIVVGVMILAGNQLFPVFLRFSIWLIYKCVPKDSEIHHTCAFLLQHPRRCFVLLFPSINTWYLLAVQLTIDFVLWAFFGILNIGLSEFDSLSAGRETAVGLFQALSVRVGGLYVVLIDNVAPALQILYLIGMYISAFPIIVSLRQTNVYEERSLGLDAHESKQHYEKRSEKNYLSVHIRRQLAYDLWWLALAIFLISIIERAGLEDDAAKYFSTWAIIFEVFSAYGTVGLSLGVPFDSYSFSGVWHTLSKLILVAVMLRGRHRGLPYAIDRAVLLPGEELMEKMDAEVNFRGEGEWGDGRSWAEREQRDPEGRDLREDERAKLRREFLGYDIEDEAR